MKKVWCLFCLGVVLVSNSFALDPLLIGNFESGQSSPNRYDLWYGDGLEIDDVTVPGKTVTRGAFSLKCTSSTGGWGPALAYPINEREDKYGLVYPLFANDGAVLAFDVTFETVPGGWVEIGHYTNNGASVGPNWDKGGWVPVPAEYLDGLPHRWAIPLEPLKASFQSVLDAPNDDGGYYNVGIAFSTGDGPFTVYVDNIWIYPEGLIDEYGPYNPAVDQEFDANPDFVKAILRWKAGADPNDKYEVNPLIVDQYVFMNKGTESDPNLYYLGRTGQDPGLTDPNSQFGPVILPINSTFGWAVVGAIEGNEQSLTEGVSTLDKIDPNNIIGAVWYFNTLSTLPIITMQPASIRIPLGQTADPAFTIAVSSATEASYQWFSSIDGTIDPVDEGGADPKIGVASGGDTASMKISNASSAYQRYFYCRVSNAATVSGGGDFPDVYSNVVTCVVERKVAEYKFENNFADTGSNVSGDLHPGTGINSPVFSTDSVEGSYSLSLNGIDQYVDLGAAAYPKAALTDADGIGGGLDCGSVLCWIKLNSIPTAEGSSRFASILSSINAGWPSTQFEFGIGSNAASEYTDTRTFIIGNTAQSAWVAWRPTWVENFNMAGDGQWHLLAVVWPVLAGQSRQIHVYVDGSLIATGDIAAGRFSAWENNVLIGAANPGGSGPTRYFDGLIDNLRVYNYALTPQTIAQEYYDVTGKSGCIYLDFIGSNLNVDNTGTSYCRVDIADFAALAQNWLADGFYP